MQELTEHIKKLKPYRWYIAAMAVGAFVGSNGVLIAIIAALFIEDTPPKRYPPKAIIKTDFSKSKKQDKNEETEETVEPDAA